MDRDDAHPPIPYPEDTAPLLLVAGAPGTGKTSLVRAIFGDEDPLPGENTDDPGPLLQITETRHISRTLQETSRSDAPDGAFHLIWYCLAGDDPGPIAHHVEVIAGIASGTGRTEPGQDHRGENSRKTIATVAAVITRCDLDPFSPLSGRGPASGAGPSLERALKKAGLPCPVFETTADPEIPLDLRALTEWSLRELPREGHRRAFNRSRHRTLKRNLALAYSVWQERRRKEIIYLRFGRGDPAGRGGSAFARTSWPGQAPPKGSGAE
ncbi:hypothetical protein AU468_11165 [Alkalispirochaeta sphaeroplastigenens]|uniref:Uncharacterized protein n=1 Tax=Alkalispirochaeta sphaeroplastigenens TaxID=1187066 RepID=A0A2S4JHB1_9SPIO|nr:GTPase domain-containing protein [Alkalispirochaeta sphaeroplastigenens]POQ98948.1 hypothetical protein AU468_11165 [Alkalispirochaeta sphaeroplastigenens]